MGDSVDRKIGEFNELLERLFETYREVFTALRCERCVKRESCDELTHEMETHLTFLTIVYDFTLRKLDETPIPTFACEATLAYAVVMRRLSKYIEYKEVLDKEFSKQFRE